MDVEEVRKRLMAIEDKDLRLKTAMELLDVVQNAVMENDLPKIKVPDTGKMQGGFRRLRDDEIILR